MATLKFKVNHLDYIMDKLDHSKLYMILHEDLHDVWVIKDGGGEAPFELPKRVINMAYVKVDPKVARVLYAKDNESSVDAGIAQDTSGTGE